MIYEKAPACGSFLDERKELIMLRWNNDYNRIAHEAIIKAMGEHQEECYAGYGMDDLCETAQERIRAHLGGVDADIHFLIGGTQTNFVAITSALRSFESVLCAESGHIACHETGAVENTGHKVQTLKTEDGKITAEQIACEAELFHVSGIQEHITCPRMVFISYPTEFGTLYTKAELQAIRKVCDEYGLYLYLDGARLGYGLGSEKCDMTLADLAELCDAFYIGGTKCGAMMGEALILRHPVFRTSFRSYMKQNGAMLAKGFLLGLQFAVLFEDGLYFDITRKAVVQAMRIREAFEKKGLPLYVESFTNQQFVILTQEQMDALAKKHIFEYQEAMPDGCHCLRFCTGWSTRDADVEELLQDIAAL